MTPTKDNDTGLIRIPKPLHTKIEKRARRNFRSIPKEVEFMYETIEQLEKKVELSKLAQTQEER